MASTFNKFGRLIQVKSLDTFNSKAVAGNLVFGQWRADGTTVTEQNPADTYAIGANGFKYFFPNKDEFDAAVERITAIETAMDKANWKVSGTTYTTLPAYVAAVIANEGFIKSVTGEEGDNALIQASEDNGDVTLSATQKLKDAVTRAEGAVTSIIPLVDEKGSNYVNVYAGAETADGEVTLYTDNTKLDTKIDTIDARDDAQDTAISANTTAISNEVTRATGVEGTLASLTTTEKGNLVAAINEVNAAAKASSTTVAEGNGINVSVATNETTGAKTYTVSAEGNAAKAIVVETAGIGVNVKSDDKYIQIANNAIETKGIDKAIEDAIEALDSSDEAVTGQVVRSVSETDGVITVTRSALADTDIKLVKKATAGEGLASEYYLENGDGTQLGDTIQIAKDQFLKEVHFYKAESDVPAGVTIPTSTEFPVIRFIFTTAAGDTESWVSVKDLVDVYTAGDGIAIDNNVVSADIASANAVQMVGESEHKQIGLVIDNTTEGKGNVVLSQSANGLSASLDMDEYEVKSVDTTADNGVALTLSGDGKVGITVTEGSVASGNTSVVTGGDVYTAIENKINGLDVTADKGVSISGNTVTVKALQEEGGLIKEGTASATFTDGANKVEASTTNGNIKIDGTETTVYTHHTQTAASAAAVKVGNDAEGHVVLGDALVATDIKRGTSSTVDADITSLEDRMDTAENDIDTLESSKVSKTTTIAGVDLDNDITKAELLDALNVEDGAQVNVLEGVQVNGTDLTIDANKKVNVTVAEGSADGTIAVNGTNVSVHGLGSAAYTDSSDYATAEQGAKADSALQSISKGTDGDYVTTTIGTKANNDQSVSVALTLQDVSTASETAKGLAEASDVKSYVDSKVGTAIQSVTGESEPALNNTEYVKVLASTNENNAVTLSSSVQVKDATDTTTYAATGLATDGYVQEVLAWEVVD